MDMINFIMHCNEKFIIFYVGRNDTLLFINIFIKLNIILNTVFIDNL